MMWQRLGKDRGLWTTAGLAVLVLGLWLRGGVFAQDQGEKSAGEKPVGAARDIVSLLETQRDAWNRGSIEEFLVPYWNSEKLTFSSGGEVRRGFAATRERYLKTYPDRQAMGRLDFSGLETTLLGADAAMVLGNWKLTRDAGPLGGNFTLILRRIDGEWKIVHDHTSRRMD